MSGRYCRDARNRGQDVIVGRGGNTADGQLGRRSGRGPAALAGGQSTLCGAVRCCAGGRAGVAGSE
jgi:hypothetical protein